MNIQWPTLILGIAIGMFLSWFYDVLKARKGLQNDSNSPMDFQDTQPETPFVQERPVIQQRAGASQQSVSQERVVISEVQKEEPVLHVSTPVSSEPEHAAPVVEEMEDSSGIRVFLYMDGSKVARVREQDMDTLYINLGLSSDEPNHNALKAEFESGKTMYWNGHEYQLVVN